MQELYDKIIEIASSYPSVEHVYLFGSRARGDADERSDIDIAIQAPKIKRKAWLELVFRVDDIETLLTIDLVRYDNADDKLRSKIDEEGRVLYEKSKA